ncbi:MAG TPA: serine/threonine protein kinase, partial [Planctomycetes bacterium]|nr:serine/threonine protein kinase [Planctomycetota bacterium]
DVYALGMTVLEAVRGALPFDPSDPEGALRWHRERGPLPDDLPPPLRELLERLLAREPSGRPSPLELPLAIGTCQTDLWRAEAAASGPAAAPAEP